MASLGPKYLVESSTWTMSWRLGKGGGWRGQEALRMAPVRADV